MTSDDCKDFIQTTIEGNPYRGVPENKDIQEELSCHVDIEDEAVYRQGWSLWDRSRWKRTVKRKIKNPADVEWMKEGPEGCCKDLEGDAPVGSIERVFLHTDCDALFSILTDPTDKQILAWTFQVD